MMRLIDADALIDDLKHDVALDQDSLDYEELTDSNREIIQFDKDCKQNAIDLLQNAPTIEPERKKGKWIPVDSYSAFGGDEATWMAHGNPVAFYYCSVCKEQAYAGEDGESLITDFCPNCGADMRKENR